MKTKTQNLKRTAYILLALGFALGGLLQGLLSQKAFALPGGGQVSSRSIKLSDSRNNQGGVTYDVKFSSYSSYTVKGIVVDFCDAASTPIVGDATCTRPNLFTVGASPSITVVSGITGSWTAASVNSGRTLKINKSAGDALTGISGTPTVVEFTINSVHNPNTTPPGTFYARVITYNDDTPSTSAFANYAAGSEGSSSEFIDYGGFALSTANVITITAKVAESMTFCVSSTNPAAPGPNCGLTGQAVTQPDLTLGHGANNILDSSQVDTKNAVMQLSTNANGGAVVRMRNDAASGGLNFGTNSIPAVNSGGASPAAIGAGVAAFGVFVATSTVVSGSGGTGTVVPDANYNDGTSTHYGMDTTSGSGANVSGTYGDVIASSATGVGGSGPVNNVQNVLTFAAQASNTTAAGIYTANIILISTGTF